MSAWRWQTAKAMARKYPSAAVGANRSVESERSTHGLTSCRSLVELTLLISAGRRSQSLCCWERGGRRRMCSLVLCLILFDLEVTAYDVRLPESRRYGEGQCLQKR